MREAKKLRVSALNLDGAHPDITDSIGFVDIRFTEQEGLLVRRSKKVSNIIDWCKKHNVKTKLWACFRDGYTQCGYCGKCVRTQLNILCDGENPKDWGFENFSEIEYTRYVKSYRYIESNPCWLWDNIETIDDSRVYPYCNELLHWLKAVGYKEYTVRSKNNAAKRAKYSKLRQALSIHRYPHYINVIVSRLLGRK